MRATQTRTAPKLTVESYMTLSPHTIGKDQPLEVAHRLMRAHDIRHLPVLEGGRVIGVVSQRDLHLVETLRDVDPAKVTVEEAMTPDPYTVAPEAALIEVVRAMARAKLGSVVVTRGGRPVGVFTTIDALRALEQQLEGIGA
jgi:acetoin utilization protein AcuB